VTLEGILLSSLTVREVGLEDGGIYKCLATRGGRQGEAEVQVNVLENESVTLPVLSKSSIEMRLKENLRFEENLNHLHQNRNMTVRMARPGLTSLILLLAFFKVIL